MRKLSINIFLIISVINFISCKQNKKESYAKKIITEWVGRTIQLPDNVSPIMLRKDTVSSVQFLTPYKILVYTDSAGCTNCKLKLSVWQELIQEIDTLMPGKLSILFYFQPKNEKELSYLIKREKFDYPVFIDKNNTIDRLNHFPSQMEYQCFLLDENNRVLMVGNPVLNPKIWSLYKQTVTDKADSDTQTMTSVSVEPETIEIPDLSAGKKSHAAFRIKNTGTELFVIYRVNASCGCTVPVWEKQPVEPGKETEIRLEIQPEEAGVFHKTVQVYGNVKEGVVTVTVKGTVKQ